MISTRNIEFSKKQIELKRDVAGYSHCPTVLGIRFGHPNMQEAVDDAIRRQGTGEYLKNATITRYIRWYVVFSVSGIKVTGDLMGYEGQELPKK